MKEALVRCVELGETPLYGVTAAELFTEMVVKHELVKFGQPMKLTFPISALEVPSLFDPKQCLPLLKKCSGPVFLHLFNETWRRAGIPGYLGPPEGSYIDHLLTKHGLPALSPRMEFAGQRALRLRVAALERENAELGSNSLWFWGRSALDLSRRVLSKIGLSRRHP